MVRYDRVLPNGRNDYNDQYMKIGYPMAKSDAWRSLNGPAVKIWMELHTRFHGGNNGALHLSLDEAAKLLHISKTTASRAFRELEEKGFIVKKLPGHWYGRKATEWALAHKKFNGNVPSNEWKRWRAEKQNSVPK